MYTKILLGVVSLFLIAGCGNKNADYANFVKSKEPATEHNVLKESLPEIKKQQEFVSIESPKSLSSVLRELEKVEGAFFDMADIKEDFLIPTSRWQVKSFQDLNEYLQQRAQKKLVVTANAFYLNKPKIIKVVDLAKDKYDFAKLKIKQFNSSKDLASALEIVAEETGFSVIFTEAQSTSLEKQQQNGGITIGVNEESQQLRWLKNKRVYLKATTVADLIENIKSAADVWVDIDYQKKIVTVSPYKIKIFKIANINDVQMEGNLKGEEIVNSAVAATGTATSSSGSTGTKNPKVKVSLYEQVEEKCSLLVGKSMISGSSNSNGNEELQYCRVMKESADIIVSASPSRMENIEKFISNFNHHFEKQVHVSLKVYEVIVQKNFSFGIDFNIMGKSAEDVMKFSSSRAASMASGATATNITANLVGKNYTADIFGDALSAFGYIYNKNDYSTLLRNHIPDSTSVRNDQEFVYKINKTITTGDNPIITETNENKTVANGYDFSAIAHINGEMVSVTLQPNITKIVNLTKQAVGTNTVMLPETSIAKLTKENLLRDGESRVIAYASFLDSSDKYEGIVPVKDFVLGGNTNDKYVKREVVFVLTVEILK